MRVLVVGLGSIGRRHIKNLKAVDRSLEVALLRQRSKSRDMGDVGGLLTQVFFDEQKALAWKPQVVVIANPAPLHIATAMRFAQAGAHLFIEKPLSVSLKGIDRLQALCRRKKLVVMVGYVLRFAPPLTAVKKVLDQGRIGRLLSVQASVGRYLPAWRKGDYRTQVTARRKLGGGVILELSHELDYVRWLAGEVKAIQGMKGKLSDFDIDVEDIAHIQMRHGKGVLSQIHLDMVDHAPNRGCRLIGTKGTVVWESVLGEHAVRLWTAGAEKWRTIYKDKQLDVNAMHKAQWKHFLSCVRKKQKPQVSLNDAKRVLELSLKVLEAR